MRASSSAILRSSASRRRASASACARALRSSSVSVRRITPEAFGAAGAGRGWVQEQVPGRRRRASAPAVRPGYRFRSGLAPGAAFDLFDHNGLAAAVAEALAHDALLDAAPLKGQRFGACTQLFAGIFGRLGHSLPFLSVTQSQSPPGRIRRRHDGLGMLIAGPKPFQAPTSGQKGFAGRAGEQGCMYHIWTVQCQIQLGRG